MGKLRKRVVESVATAEEGVTWPVLSYPNGKDALCVSER